MFPVIILAVIFSFILIVIKMGMNHSQEQERIRAGMRQDQGLKVSELRSLIREAVDEANEPLLQRMEDLEQRLQLPEARASSGRAGSVKALSEGQADDEDRSAAHATASGSGS